MLNCLTIPGSFRFKIYNLCTLKTKSRVHKIHSQHATGFNKQETSYFQTNTEQIPFSLYSVYIFIISLQDTLICYYKHLGSYLSPQSCLHFQCFWDSKLLNGCLVVWLSNLCLRRIQHFSGIKAYVYHQWFKFFVKMFLRQLNFSVLSV